MTDNEIKCPHCNTVSNIGGLVGEHTNDCPKCGKNVFKQAVSDLQNHVNDIARRISEADFDLNDDGDECSAFDYLQDALDIEYIVASDKKTLLGARVIVAFGGPNIWVNTRTNTVEGHWWGDSASATFTDSIGLQDALEELFQC